MYVRSRLCSQQQSARLHHSIREWNRKDPAALNFCRTLQPDQRLCGTYIGAYHSSWSPCLGHDGIEKMNENGQRLLELCYHLNLCITNTYVNTKPQHIVSWRHPRSTHWHQPDLAVTRRSSLNSIQLTRGYLSADCNTDHCCSVLQGEASVAQDALPQERRKTPPRHKQDLGHQERVAQFARELRGRPSWGNQHRYH